MEVFLTSHVVSYCVKRSLHKRSLIKLFTQAHWFRVVSRSRLFGSGQISGQVQAGFGLKFVKMFQADCGPA